MFSLLDLFCTVDDFRLANPPQQRLLCSSDAALRSRNRKKQLADSEIMTILIAFHQSRYRDFKTFYLAYVCLHWRKEFPRLVSYNRFIEWTKAVLVPLFAYLQSLFGVCSGVSFLDSTPLSVCDNRRIPQHKVFAGIAKRGKTSVGWFFGFKLHLVVSDTGELLAATLTAGNVNDRKPVPDLLSKILGKVYADKGYIGQNLFDTLFVKGVELITKSHKKMKPRLLTLMDKLLLRKRAIIETIIDQLKNISQVEHTRHRAPVGFLWNLAAALIAYCHQPKKPSLNLTAQAKMVNA